MPPSRLPASSVKRRLIAGILVLLCFMIAAGTGGLWGMRTINDSFSQVYKRNILPIDTIRTINNLFQIDLMHAVDEVLYAKDGWQQGLRTTRKLQGELDSHWRQLLQRDTLGGRKDTAAQEELWQLRKETNVVLSQLIGILKERRLDALDDLLDRKLTPLAALYRTRLDGLIRDRIATSRSQYEKAVQKYHSSQQAFFFTIFLAVTVGLAVGIFMTRSIDDPLSRITTTLEKMMQGDLTKRMEYDRDDEFGTVINGFNKMVSYLAELVKQIQRSGIQVASSITEIAATTKEQEATANEHAATTSEIAASSTEIAATSTSLMATMKRVNSLTKNTAYAIEEGHSGLLNIDTIMSSMEEATGSIVDKLSILNEKAANVAGVVKTINKVADQTNLLSLNAAIEAEKAGEYGAGFAVVATEIRRLADQTAVATFDIEQMVHDVQASVASAVMGIDTFANDVRGGIGEIQESGEKLTHVIEQVEALVPQVEAMNDGIEAQALGAKQISDAISQLNEAAQQTAASLSQNSKTIGQLQQASLGLQQAIARFTIEEPDAAPTV